MVENLSIFSSKDFFKFVKKFVLFIIILIIADQILGFALRYLYNRTTIREIGQINHVLNQKADIFILGSSRAKYHYDPKIISKQTNKTVFNAGIEGQGMAFFYGLLCLITEKYTPEIIVLNFDPKDINYRKDALEKLSYLLPHRENNCVNSLVLQRSRFEKLKLLSASYSYNSMILSLIWCAISKKDNQDNNGYAPVYGKLPEESIANDGKKSTSVGIKDKQRSAEDKEFFEQIIDEFFALAKSKNIKIYVSLSPYWNEGKGGRSNFYLNIEDTFIKKIKTLGIPMIHLERNDYPELDDRNLYRDSYHLNIKGAEFFSKQVGIKLNELSLNGK